MGAGREYWKKEMMLIKTTADNLSNFIYKIIQISFIAIQITLLLSSLNSK